MAAKKVELYSTSTRATEEEEYSEAAAEDKVELTLKTPLMSDVTRPLSRVGKLNLLMRTVPTCVQAQMESIRKILTDISCSEGETNAALEALAELYCGDVHEDIQKFAFTSGITKRLVGILRSLSNPSLLATAARCLSLIAYGNQDAKTYFARLKAIPVFLSLCEPLCKASAHKMEEQRLLLYEHALVAVRTLTFQNSDNQRLFIDNGGVKRLVAVCNSCLSPERTTYRAEAADKLATLVLGKKMICRALNATKGSPLHSSTVKMFPSLSKNESAIGSQYPAYLIDLANEEQHWIADQMIEANVALGAPLEWPDESAVKWTCVRVTAVEDGGHVWCQFLSKEVHSRVTKMVESLESMVRFSSHTSTLSFFPSGSYPPLSFPPLSFPPLSSPPLSFPPLSFLPLSFPLSFPPLSFPSLPLLPSPSLPSPLHTRITKCSYLH